MSSYDRHIITQSGKMKQAFDKESDELMKMLNGMLREQKQEHEKYDEKEVELDNEEKATYEEIKKFYDDKQVKYEMIKDQIELNSHKTNNTFDYMKIELNEMKKRISEIERMMSSVNRSYGDNMNKVDSILNIIDNKKNLYHYKDPKEKWEIDMDIVMIVGKYFISSSDYINTMKLCRKYHDLVEMYHFNPIEDTSLFINMETQHFYVKGISKKKANMHQYVYWYLNPYGINESTASVINKDDVLKNLPQMEVWSGKKVSRVLYDSEQDGKKGDVFRSKIEGKNHLYFIVIDSEKNVFGHYHNSSVGKVSEEKYDKDIFIFTLCSKGRRNVKKCNSIQKEKIYTTISEDDDFFWCGSTYGGFQINEIDTNGSWINNGISKYFDVKVSDIIGYKATVYGSSDFTVKRLLVIQMKD